MGSFMGSSGGSNTAKGPVDMTGGFPGVKLPSPAAPRTLAPPPAGGQPSIISTNNTNVSTPMPTAAQTTFNHAGYDTSMDAGWHAANSQVEQLGAYQGTSLFNQKNYDTAIEARLVANQARWQTVFQNGATTPAKAQLKALLESGQISWRDVASNIDIGLAGQGQDSALAQQLDALVKSKTAGPVLPPVDDAAQKAHTAAADTLSAVNKYANDAVGQFDAALGKADDVSQQNQNEIGSKASSQANNMGGAFAGSQANQAAAGNMANTAAQENTLQKDQYAAVNKYVNDALTNNIDTQMQGAGNDVAGKFQVQSQAFNGLIDEIKKGIRSSDTAAQGRVNEVQAAIQNWQAMTKGSEEQTQETHRIIGLIGGIVMTGAGAGMAAASGGTLAAPGAMMAAGGLSTIAASAKG